MAAGCLATAAVSNREVSLTRKQESDDAPDDLVVVGRITTVHGVQGWVKIHSFTEPESNIFDYQPWWLAKVGGGSEQIAIDQYRSTPKGFLAHIVGLDDRDLARLYCQRDIQVSVSSFPAAAPDEFYWHQLKGLRVVTSQDGKDVILGTVTDFLETGANDVMVVKGDEHSLDRVERLIPYVDLYIEEVDLSAGIIRVDWDPSFDLE